VSLFLAQGKRQLWIVSMLHIREIDLPLHIARRKRNVMRGGMYNIIATA
jgi:hypothetical protein